MNVVVATHGHCFDGLSSAVLFTRLLRALEPKLDRIRYLACGYGAGQNSATEKVLEGDQNAILDYRFTVSDKLTWYFDHHRTAFANDADRAHFEARKQTGRYFFDASYSSCTKLIADVMRERFGLREPDLDELVRWADLIDSANFETAEAACDFSSPVMRLVSVVEHCADDGFIARFVEALSTRPLTEVADGAEVQRRYRPLGKKHERFVKAVEARAKTRGRVVFVDLTDERVDLVGKFVTYARYPDSTYSVVVARLKRGYKISVGYNPWCGNALDRDISALCARHGGGGHRAVGGISLADGQGDRARAIADEIVAQLASEA